MNEMPEIWERYCVETGVVGERLLDSSERSGIEMEKKTPLKMTLSHRRGLGRRSGGTRLLLIRRSDVRFANYSHGHHTYT